MLPFILTHSLRCATNFRGCPQYNGSSGSQNPDLAFQTSKEITPPPHRSVHDRAGTSLAPSAASPRASGASHGRSRPSRSAPLRRPRSPPGPAAKLQPAARTCRRRAPPPCSPARRGGPAARYLRRGRRLRPCRPPRCAARRLVTDPYRREGISLLAASLPRRNYARGQSYPQAAAKGFSLSLAGLLRWQSQC